MLRVIPAELVQTLVAGGAGSTIGDMTLDGGLAACFDGNKSQADGVAARKAGGSVETFVGKDWGGGVTRTITGIKVWGSSDRGFHRDNDTDTVVVTLQGSTDNFSASIVDLGNFSFTDPGDDTEKSKLSGLTATAYRYHRIKFGFDTSAGSKLCAEVEFYEDV